MHCGESRSGDVITSCVVWSFSGAKMRKKSGITSRKKFSWRINKTGPSGNSTNRQYEPAQLASKKRLLTPVKTPFRSPFKSPLYTASPARKKTRRTSARSLFTCNENASPIDEKTSDVIEAYSTNQDDTPMVNNELKNVSVNTDIKRPDSLTRQQISEEMQRLIPEVIERLSHAEGSDITMLHFFRQVQMHEFPLDNIAFLLWTDVVKWFTCDNTTRMRYSDKSKTFWKLGWKMFGGRFLNFMSGLKHDTQVLQGISEKGKFCPETSSINFSVPDSKILRKFDPYQVQGGRQPGMYEDIMAVLSENLEHQSTCLTFDGKKLKQGLTGRSGDVDLLGFESGKSLRERQDELQIQLDVVDNRISEIECVGLADSSKESVKNFLMNTMHIITTNIQTVKEIRKKKEYCKDKLIERGGDTHWRKGKYVYAICAVIAFVHDIDLYICEAKRAIDTICRLVSCLNHSKYVVQSIVDLDGCDNHEAITPDTHTETITNTRLVKQRSDQWFHIRQNAKVTGSTLYRAIGGEGIGQEKEHFEHVVCGVPEREHSDEVKRFMKHGCENEPNAVATIVGKVLPVLSPELVFCEEGCVEVKGPDNTTFLVVSPDGSLRRSASLNETEIAIEIKCPVNRVHTSIPPRYILQCLSEMEVLDVHKLLFVSWTADECIVIELKRNTPLFQKSMKLAMKIYGADNLKKPTKVSEEFKEIQEEIKRECKSAKMIGQFPSASAGDGTNEYSNDECSVIALIELLNLIKEVYSGFYDITREKASEAVVFLCSDLNRSWVKDKMKSAPVCWFPKGYSLPTETLRHIAEDVSTKCHDVGIHMPCQSFDGQWHVLVVRSLSNKPLTKLQLQKDVWKSTEKMGKQNIMAVLKSMNTKSRVEVVQKPTDEKDSESGTNKVIVVTNDGIKLPTLVRRKQSVKQKVMPAECLGNSQQTLFDVVPESVQEGCETSVDLLVTTTVDANEMEAFSSNIQENDWIDQLNDVPDEPEIQQQSDTRHGTLSALDGSEHTVMDGVSTNDNNKFVFAHEEAEHVLAMLRTDKSCNKKDRWSHLSADDVIGSVQSVDTLNALKDVDLKVIVRYLKRTKGFKLKESVSKCAKINALIKVLNIDEPAIELPCNTRGRKKTAKTLSELSAGVIVKEFTKFDLNCMYAEYIWPEKVHNWKMESPLNSNPTICGNEVEWFYIPEFSERRNQLEVRCIDSTHLLTRTRRKSCKGGLDYVANTAWLKVAKSRKTFLTSVMVEEITDPMSVSLAATHFGDPVETVMRDNGDTDAADLCSDIRSWWESEDSPGIPAIERINMRHNLRQRLLDKVNFGKFPPPTMHIAGWPLQLWEAMLSNIDAKAQLYALSHGGTYNVRAFSSMIGETFFSELTLNDKRGHGTVSSHEFGEFIGSTIEQMQIRLDPNRTFPYRTAKKTAYKLVEDAECMPVSTRDACPACQLPHATRIERINPRDHQFDAAERKRIKGRRKQATVSTDRNSLQRGALGVRWEVARRNESKMLITTKMGIGADNL